MRSLILFLLLGLSITSCYKNHLYVQHDKLNKDYLASTYVGTPDPRLKHPPEGQRISVAWDFPLSLFRKDLSLILTVRLWDNTQDVFTSKVEVKRGYKIYMFQDDSVQKSKRILTYKVDVVSPDGQIVDQWKHQFWKKQIKINKEEHVESVATEEDYGEV